MTDRVSAKIIYAMHLEVNQYGGLYRTSAIAGAAVMVLAWLTTFFVVWHRIGRAETREARVRIGFRWTMGAAGMYLVFALIEWAVIGSWPLVG